jgi:hypothetical protein
VVLAKRGSYVPADSIILKWRADEEEDGPMLIAIN